MDPTNPRWETREIRRAKSATLWKVVAGAAGASALTAMVVASCLDRDVARRTPNVAEPAYVETTAGTPPPPVAANPAGVTASAPELSTTDSTGGVSDRTSTVQTTGATVVVPAGATTINNITNITPPSTPADTSSGVQTTRSVQGVAAAPQANPSTSPTTQVQAPAQAAGSNPDAPPMSAGAGPFITEAPYWTSSAFPTNPDAGAGQFGTERNTPAR